MNQNIILNRKNMKTFSLNLLVVIMFSSVGCGMFKLAKRANNQCRSYSMSEQDYRNCIGI